MPLSAAALPVSPDDLARLRRWSNATQVPAVVAQRAKILLLAAEGVANTEIARRLGISRPTVIAWRKRYIHRGLAYGLADQPRGGRPESVRRDRRAEILATTLSPPPEALGVTHWSSRLLAAELGVSHSTVARVWAEHDLKPWQVETFKFSTDPQLEAKVRDVVGLYLDPPAHAIVLCVDEKSQIQALERTQPPCPVAPGRPERRTHDYRRHGTTTLFAALEVTTGQVTDVCHPRHRHSEFLEFLKLVAKAYPRRQLQVVLDNYATHKHAKVQAWLGNHPRVRLHFTPTYASWLNLVECASQSWNARRSAAATLALWRSWWQRSAGSVMAGTTAASRSAGPSTPTSSWHSATANHTAGRQRLAYGTRTSLRPCWPRCQAVSTSARGTCSTPTRSSPLAARSMNWGSACMMASSGMVPAPLP
jgi:transposase